MKLDPAKKIPANFEITGGPLPQDVGRPAPPRELVIIFKMFESVFGPITSEEVYRARQRQRRRRTRRHGRRRRSRRFRYE